MNSSTYLEISKLYYTTNEQSYAIYENLKIRIVVNQH